MDHDRSQEKAREVVGGTKAAETRVIPVRRDVSKTNEVEVVFKTTVNESGKAGIIDRSRTHTGARKHLSVAGFGLRDRLQEIWNERTVKRSGELDSGLSKSEQFDEEPA